MTSGGALDHLSGELGDAFDRMVAQRRRRRRIAQRSVAGAGLAIVALLTLVVVDRGTPAEAGVEVIRRDGRIFVRLTDLEHRPDVIEKATADAGLDVTIDAVPTGPSLVGHFVRFDQGDGAGDIELVGEDGFAFEGFSLPEAWDGRLELEVGRPAERDEPYALASNALSQGEPLACTDILGSSSSVARELVAEAGVVARWQAARSSGLGVEQLDRAQLDDEPWSDLAVTSVLSIAPDTVLVRLGDLASVSDDRLPGPADC